MGREKYKSKPTGRQRRFSATEDLIPFTFSKPEAEEEFAEESEEEVSSEEEERQEEKKKGVEGIIEIENPNLAKPKKMLKARDIDIEKTSELSRREREEIEKQRSRERYTKLQEQGKTEQEKKDLERLSLVRQQRAEAAKKREEEKSAKEEKKVQSRKPLTKK